MDDYRYNATKIRYFSSDEMKTGVGVIKESYSGIFPSMFVAESDKSINCKSENLICLDGISPNDTKDDNQNRKNNGIRHCVSVEQDIIKAFVSRLICDVPYVPTVESYLETIRSSHDVLIMPRSDESSRSAHGHKIQLSTPPGLRNLGATCYLNSQLQCLAQNLGFIHGLFSWKKPLLKSESDLENRMNHVLSTMQTVLARIRYGPDSVVCTEEFAKALCLESDEMQDPNEVSRIIFFTSCYDRRATR